MYSIQPISAADAPRFSALARRAYPPSYAHFWTDGGAWYAEKYFNETQLLTELAAPDSAFFFVLDERDEAIGFVKINWKKAPLESHLEPEKCAELERIYFLNEAGGKGAGQFAMTFFLKKCAEKKVRIAWLRVMGESKKAQQFYERFGFQKVKSAQLDFELLKPEMCEILTFLLVL